MEILENLQVILILMVLTMEDLLEILIMEILILVALEDVDLGIIERTLLKEEFAQRGVVCQICFKFNHTAAECRNRFNKNFAPSFLVQGYPPN